MASSYTRHVRRQLALIVALAACGDNKKLAADAPSPGSDSAPPPPMCTPAHGTNIAWTQVAAIGGTATLVTSPPDDPRLFVVIESGSIWIVDNGKPLPDPFFDAGALSPMFVGGNQTETGLLGLAFDPGYATNRTFFIFYTARNPNDPGGYPYLDVLVRLQTRADDPSHADPATATTLIAIPDIAANHNGGMLEFGRDGYLYVSTGDGGFQEDPARTGQDPHALLGKLLRIDVEQRQPGLEYAIPADNPFADGTSGAPEVFIMGVRNPWRFALDPVTGDMWIGDVGQDTIEELDLLPPGGQNGANLGWSMYEGENCFHAPCDRTGLTFPVFTQTHAAGACAVIGGAVYRGDCYPDLVGRYFFTDFCSPVLRRADVALDGTVTVTEHGAIPGGGGPASLHPGAGGELYLGDVEGNIFRLEARP